MKSLLNRLLEMPAVYSTWQRPFVSQKFAPVARNVRVSDVRRILDVGCGPGTNAKFFAGTDYVGVDINEHYLSVARSRHGGRFIQADLASTGIAGITGLGCFDTILVNSFLHHLPDEPVTRVLANSHDLLDGSGRIHILELVLPDSFSLSRMMARLDRGRYARPLPAWERLFNAHFDPVVFEQYSFGFGLWAMVYFQGRRR